jgi:conjugal transfer pilus assembly protein TraF
MIIFIYIMTSLTYANYHYYDSEPRGWHWYDNPTPTYDDEDEETPDPLDAMNAENKAILRALYTARKYPTKENVKNYIAMQHAVMGEARKFSHVWEAVLIENPELNYAIKHPTNNYARMIEEDELRKKEEAAIQQLAKVSGLFFFYRSTCPYCRAFAPTLKQFAEQYGIKVVPITTDGISLPQFPDSRLNQGQAEAFGVKAEPALFAVNPYTQKAFPITYGLISFADLKRRILDIATQFDGDLI